MIPFVDLNRQYETIKPEIDQAIKDVIRETAFIGGKRISEFETAFSQLVGSQALHWMCKWNRLD